MAEAGTYEGYKESGFNEASGVPPLQERQGSMLTTDEGLRQQAEEQYKPTYEALDRSYSEQLTRLITSQATDEKLLNEQYNNSISSMAAQLQKRGLMPTVQLPEAQTAALNKHRNEALTFRQGVYKAQRTLPEQQRDLLRTGYENAINQRVAANRETNIPIVSDLLAKIAQLQQASFDDYLNFLLSKKSGGGGGGGRRRGSSTSTSTDLGDASGASGNDFGGDYIVHDIYTEGYKRRQSNYDQSGTRSKTYTSAASQKRLQGYQKAKQNKFTNKATKK